MEEDNWRMTAVAIAAVLGGKKTLKKSVETETGLRLITREGLPVATLPQLAEKLGVERRRLAKVVGISDRTLSRRLAKKSKLSAEESDRTMRLARVFAKAEDTFGTSEKASQWMQRPLLALGNEIPLDLMDTDAGARAVEAALYRIDYGVYS